MIRDPERLIGRRFTCDLRVAAVAPGPPGDGSRIVTLWMHGERAEISLAEFSQLVESGFVMEVPEGGR